MFKNTFQSGFLSILYSIGSKPLQIWDKKVRKLFFILMKLAAIIAIVISDGNTKIRCFCTNIADAEAHNLIQHYHIIKE